MDVIALHQAGFTQAVACLGTALTKDQAQLLSRYAEEVVLSYDADEAGQAATRKALAVLGQTPLKLRVIQLSGGKDPDEILRAWGPEKYRLLLEGAANDIEFKLLAARGGLDLTVAAGKAEYLREAVKVLAHCGAIERDIYASRLSEELGVGKEAILTQAGQARKREEWRLKRDWQRERLKLQEAKALKIDPRRGQHPAAAKAEERLLGLLLRHPDFYLKLRDELKPGDFVTPFNRELCEKLCARLEEGRGVEPELLSGALNQQELDEAMRMRALAEGIDNPLAELLGCARKILEEKKGLGQVDLSALERGEWGNLFQQFKRTDIGG
jgi:DNA primase